MIIKLYDLQDTISVKGSLDGAKFKRPEDTDIGFASPIEYEITIQKAGDNVWLSGPVSAEAIADVRPLPGGIHLFGIIEARYRVASPAKNARAAPKSS